MVVVIDDLDLDELEVRAGTILGSSRFEPFNVSKKNDEKAKQQENENLRNSRLRLFQNITNFLYIQYLSPHLYKMIQKYSKFFD